MKFSKDDEASWLPLVRDVIRTFGGGFPYYVDVEDLQQECLIKIPGIIASYCGRNGASAETFVRGAVRNDVRDFLKDAHSKHKRMPVTAYPWETKRTEDADGDFVSGNSRAESVLRGDYLADSGGQMRPTRRSDFRRVDMQTEVNEAAIEMLCAAKGVLTAEQYSVVDCRERLGMTQEQTGEYLGISREAVASRERKAIAKLRKAGVERRQA